jgi:hypothetical protein
MCGLANQPQIAKREEPQSGCDRCNLLALPMSEETVICDRSRPAIPRYPVKQRNLLFRSSLRVFQQHLGTSPLQGRLDTGLMGW